MDYPIVRRSNVLELLEIVGESQKVRFGFENS
jgi:hypothetical protein